MINPFEELYTRLKRIEKLLQTISYKELKTNEDINNFLSKAEVCKILGISQSTLWRWTIKGILISYGIENRVYYKKSEIMEAIKKIR